MIQIYAASGIAPYLFYYCNGRSWLDDLVEFDLYWVFFITVIFLGTVVLIFFTLLTTVLAYLLYSWMATRLQKITSENQRLKWWTSHMLEICVLSTMFVFITYTPSACKYISIQKKIWRVANIWHVKITMGPPPPNRIKMKF